MLCLHYLFRVRSHSLTLWKHVFISVKWRRVFLPPIWTINGYASISEAPRELVLPNFRFLPVLQNRPKIFIWTSCLTSDVLQLWACFSYSFPTGLYIVCTKENGQVILSLWGFFLPFFFPRQPFKEGKTTTQDTSRNWGKKKNLPVQTFWNSQWM